MISCIINPLLRAFGALLHLALFENAKKTSSKSLCPTFFSLPVIFYLMHDPSPASTDDCLY
jgi:hypothetical protein